MNDFDQYQTQTEATAIYPEAGRGTYNALQYAALGLVGEAGEIAGKVKKIYRDKSGEISQEDKQELMKELGDVAWYVARFADELGVCFSDVVDANIKKLLSRMERGVIGGSGDNR